MTSLLDIGPLTEEVPVGGKSVTVYGVTPEGFFFLLHKFPLLAEMFSGGQKNVDMNSLQAVAPDCIAYALAVATTSRAYMTNKDWIAIVESTANIAMNLPAHIQMALFHSAIRLTFPDGIGPFMEAVDRLAESINRVSGQTVPVTTSSKPSHSGFEMDSRGMRLGKIARPASSRH